MLLALACCTALQAPPNDPEPPLQVLVPSRYSRLHYSPESGHGLLVYHDTAWITHGESMDLVARVRSLPGPDGRDRWTVSSINPDGTRAYLMTRNGTRALVDLETGEVLREALGSGPNIVRRVSPDLEHWVSLDQGALTARRTETGEKVYRIPVSSNLMAFTSKGLLVHTTEGLEHLLWDGERHTIEAAIPTKVHRSTDHLYVLAGSEEIATLNLKDYSVRTLNLDGIGEVYVSGDMLALRSPGWIAGFRISTGERVWERTSILSKIRSVPEFDLLLVEESGKTNAIDMASGESLWEVSAGTYTWPWTGVECTGDGLMLRQYRGEVVVLDAKTGEVLRSTSGYGSPRAIGALGSAAWIASSDGQITTLDLDTGATIAQSAPGLATRFAQSSGEHLATIDLEFAGTILLGAGLEGVGSFEAGNQATFSPGGEWLWTWSGKPEGLRRIRVASGDLDGVVAMGTPGLRNVASSSDGRVVAATDGSRSPHLWRDGEAIPLKGAGDVRALAMSPDGEHLAIGNNAVEAMVFHTTDGQVTHHWSAPGFYPFGGSVRHLTFAPDSNLLAGTMGDLAAIAVWDLDRDGLAWNHEYNGGNPGSVIARISPNGNDLWVYGMTQSVPARYNLANGKRRLDLSKRGLIEFVPLDDGALALKGDALVRLDADGKELWWRLDLGVAGVLRIHDGEVTGPESALRRVYLGREGKFERGDEFERE